MDSLTLADMRVMLFCFSQSLAFSQSSPIFFRFPTHRILKAHFPHTIHTVDPINCYQSQQTVRWAASAVFSVFTPLHTYGTYLWARDDFSLPVMYCFSWGGGGSTLSVGLIENFRFVIYALYVLQNLPWGCFTNNCAIHVWTFSLSPIWANIY